MEKLSTFILKQPYNTFILIYQQGYLTDTIFTDSEEMYNIRKDIRDKTIIGWENYTIQDVNLNINPINCIKVEV